MQNQVKINNQSGAAILVSVVFFLFISLSTVFGLVSPTVRELKNASVDLNSRRSYFLAESGMEDVIYRTASNMTVEANEILTLGSNSATTTVTTLLGGSKQISTIGDVLSYQRKSNATLTTGDGVVFKYGTQAGQGGFVFRNNSYVMGSLYSNGDIVGSNGAYITGDAYVAGASGSISNMRVGYEGVGTAHANSITNSTVTGNLFCKTGSGNNKNCDSSQDNPPSEDLPISEEDILEWKNDAESGEITTGDVTISSPTTMGLRKINGNLIIDDILTLSDTVYVTGNIIINVGKTLQLDSSYGATSGIIIADGYVIINNNVIFNNSGTAGSYILILSDSVCDESMSGSPCNGQNAIEVRNNSEISIVNAQKGTVYFSNNARVKEAVGNKIILNNNVGIEYGSGLINANFTSGPSGAWTIGDWGESQ